MADEIVGDAAEAVAAEGGAVVLIPNEEAEAAEHQDAPEAPAVVVVEAPADDGPDGLDALVSIVGTFHADMVDVIERLGRLEGRLDALDSLQAQAAVEPEPMAEETIVAPTEEIAPPKAEEDATASAPKKHAGFWV